MTDDQLSYEEIEQGVHHEPMKVTARLPNNTARRSAERHIELAYEYAKESREQKADS